MRKGGAIHERRALGDHRVEPVAKLPGKALGDHVRREPFGPVLRVMPVAQRRERHDSGVEPGVADVLDARNRFPAVGAGDLDLVDPGPVRRVPGERLPALDRAIPEFGLTADDVDVAAGRALIDGKRQSPVALLGDHPVVHVRQPVELAIQTEARMPGRSGG